MRGPIGPGFNGGEEVGRCRAAVSRLERVDTVGLDVR